MDDMVLLGSIRDDIGCVSLLVVLFMLVLDGRDAY